MCQLRTSGAVDARGWERLGGGYEADIYATSALFEGARHQLAVRLCRSASPDRVRQEAEVMRSLHSHEFPVPRIFCCSPPDNSTGRPFVVMERVRGRSLGEDYWSADPTHRAEARSLLLGLHHRLHGIDPDSVLPLRVRKRTLAGDLAWLETELAHRDDRIRQAFASVPDRLRSDIAHIQPERVVVVHGDFHYNNVLIGDDGAATVIDWSNVCAADPRTDLAWLRMVTGDPDIDAYFSDAGKAEDLDVFEAVATAQVLLDAVTTLINSNSEPGAIGRARAGASHTIAAVARLQDLIQAPIPSLAQLVDVALAPTS
jgi:aminoglycoside phosphotransferase (APT) family kinase protein